MGDETKKESIEARLEEVALRERHKKEVLEKELIVRERRADSIIEKIVQNDHDLALAKTIDYGKLTEEDILAKQKENEDYMAAAKSNMPFINKTFDGYVPFFRKNIILIGAKSGDGKSTTVANITRVLIASKNPHTDKRRRVLIITNEEKSEDVYNRVTALSKGWKYTNHHDFTPEQIATFTQFIKILSKDGMMTVIDDNYGGAMGTTTSIEGICQIFDSLLERKDYYDAVIIDYYQNITDSKKSLEMGEYEVQASLVRRLDKYKNIYPAPIVIMAQVREPDQSKTPFKIRIEGRKTILNVATCAIEMTANHSMESTDWRIHKSRFNEAIGKTLTTGYQNGAYVMYDQQFIAGVEKRKADKERKEFDKQIKMPIVKTEEEEVKNEVPEKASSN